MTTQDELLTPPALAARLGVREQTLADWRFRRVGPTYVKCGKLIRYPAAELAAWLQTQRVDTVAATGGAVTVARQRAPRRRTAAGLADTGPPATLAAGGPKK